MIHTNEKEGLVEAKYDILHHQSITCLDAYGIWSDKDPGTHGCENMVVKIILPEEKVADIEVNVIADSVRLISKRFYLDLPLPRPAVSDSVKAKWISDKDTLRLEIPIKR